MDTCQRINDAAAQIAQEYFTEKANSFEVDDGNYKVNTPQDPIRRNNQRGPKVIQSRYGQVAIKPKLGQVAMKPKLGRIGSNRPRAPNPRSQEETEERDNYYKLFN